MSWSPSIELGEWLPDQPQLKGPSLRDARGVIPRARGYDVFPGYDNSNRGVLPSRCRGAMSGRTRQGTDFIVAGTISKLFVSTTTVLTDETWLVGPYVTDHRWDFALFGDDIIAINSADAPQRYVLGTSLEFADLNANAPRARHCAVVREFLVMGNLVGRGTHAAIYGTREDGVHWSAQGDAGNWQTAGTNAAAAVLSDWQALIDNGGKITDVVGGQDYGLIFKERSIWRMDFEGGNTFFSFNAIESARGCIVPGSAIRVAGRTYFISEGGLCYTDGGGSAPFGNERVDAWLQALIDSTQYDFVSTFVHPNLPLIGWGFRSRLTSSNLADYILLYNYAVDRFTYHLLSHECLISATPQGASLDDPPYAAANMDTFAAINTPNHLDLLTGGIVAQLGFFASDHQLFLFEEGGANQSGLLETGDMQLIPGREAVVNGVRPLYSRAGVAYQAAVQRKRRIQDAPELIDFGQETPSGACRGRASGRYHALRLTLSGNYGEVHGVEADVVPGGGR